jgi:hypothetical protein
MTPMLAQEGNLAEGLQHPIQKYVLEASRNSAWNKSVET